jgi:hypothetical protein
MRVMGIAPTAAERERMLDDDLVAALSRPSTV